MAGGSPLGGREGKGEVQARQEEGGTAGKIAGPGNKSGRLDHNYFSTRRLHTSVLGVHKITYKKNQAQETYCA